MAITAYFDTNVFNHIHKGEGYGVTDLDLETLRSAVKTGEVSIVLSIHVLEELLATLPSSLDLARALVRLFLDLADWGLVVKPAHLLLSDDIISYARGEVLNNPFLESGTLEVIRSNLQALLDLDPKDMSELLVDVKEAQKQKEDFRAGIIQAKQAASLWAKQLEKVEGWQPCFDDYWKRNATQSAEDFAKKISALDACKSRGIEGMLEVRSIRMCVGVHLSYTYAQTFEGRTPQIGDSRDMQHAVVATAADVFVIHDPKLKRLLDRIPLSGVRVSSLQEFLALVR